MRAIDRQETTARIRRTAPRDGEGAGRHLIDLLKVENVGVTDNFFDLGGYSLWQAGYWRVANAFGVSLPIKAVFRSADY